MGRISSNQITHGAGQNLGSLFEFVFVALGCELRVASSGRSEKPTSARRFSTKTSVEKEKTTQW
jgi:hypothetical protein